LPVHYESTLKPVDVETPLDVYVLRPIAHLFVLMARATPLSANGMTLLAVIVGLSGASLLRYPYPKQIIAGAFLLVLYAVLDCADGQLARARKASSRTGRILDGLGYCVVSVATAATIIVRVGDEGGAASAVFAVLGFGSAGVQGAMFDTFKNRYLTSTRSSYREGDDLAQTEYGIEHGGADFHVLLYRAYAALLRVERIVAGGEPREAETPEAAAAYARELRPVMRGWAYLGGSTHLVATAVFASVGLISVYVWIRLTVGNLAMAILFLAHRRGERALAPPVAVDEAEPPPPEAQARPADARPADAPVETPAPAAPRKEPAPISFHPPPPDD
jgi:hypothetical protein